MTNLTDFNEAETRQLLKATSSPYLLRLLETAEAVCAEQADGPLAWQAASEIVGWILDELEARYPRCVRVWKRLQWLGFDTDLVDHFRRAVRG